MSKRKKKEKEDLLVDSKGKRMRENGRLQLQEDDDSDEVSNQIQLLKDAGVDEETMRTISDHEKQAIIKAIVESNHHQELCEIESSGSGESRESSSVPHHSSVDEDTQPPDAMNTYDDSALPLGVCSRRYLTPVKKAPEKCSALPYELSTADDEDTQPDLQLGIPKVLTTETQFSPRHDVDSGESDFETVPDSLVPQSPDLELSTDNEAKEYDETESCCLNRTYPKRTTAIQQIGNYLPKSSSDNIKDSSCYTQVIKLMFDIYIRRLRSAQSWLKGESEQWGKPVKPGNHCECLLRKKVLEKAKAGRNENARGRGRRSVRQKPEAEAAARSEDEEDIENQLADLGEENLAEMDIVKVAESPPHTELIDNAGKSCDVDTVEGVNFAQQSSHSDEMNVSNATELRRTLRNKTRNQVHKKGGEPNTVLHSARGEMHSLPQQSTSNSLVKKKACEDIKCKETVAIVVEDFMEDKATDRSWLSSQKGKGKRRVNGETEKDGKQVTRNKYVTESLQIEKTERLCHSKNKRQTKVDVHFTQASIFVPEKDLYVIEDGSDSNPLPDIDINYEDSGKKWSNDKYEENISERTHGKDSSVVGGELVDDVSSSLDSGFLLNSDGDMYCTQIAHSSKERDKRTKPVSMSAIHEPEIITSESAHKIEDTRQSDNIATSETCDIITRRRKQREMQAHDICNSPGDVNKAEDVRLFQSDKDRNIAGDIFSGEKRASGRKSQSQIRKKKRNLFEGVHDDTDDICNSKKKNARKVAVFESTNNVEDMVLVQSKKNLNITDEIRSGEESSSSRKAQLPVSKKKRNRLSGDSYFVQEVTEGNSNSERNNGRKVAVSEPTKKVEDMRQTNKTTAGKGDIITNKRKPKERDVVAVCESRDDVNKVEDVVLVQSESEKDLNISDENASGEESTSDCKAQSPIKKRRRFFEGGSNSSREMKGKQLCKKMDRKNGAKHTLNEFEKDEVIDLDEVKVQHHGRNLVSSKTTPIEETSAESECPICGKRFDVKELEDHASTCGEEVQASPSSEDKMVRCMICGEEISQEGLKEHQSQCINVRAKEEKPTKRMTRGLRSNPRKKQAVVEIFSPSSSGDDYGELVVEHD